VTLDFSEDGIRRLAEIAWSVNERTENIGARRLYTVMERLLEEVSFCASEGRFRESGHRRRLRGHRLAELAQNEDLSRYVLVSGGNRGSRPAPLIKLPVQRWPADKTPSGGACGLLDDQHRQFGEVNDARVTEPSRTPATSRAT
jgi:hypothetical protein